MRVILKILSAALLCYLTIFFFYVARLYEAFAHTDIVISRYKEPMDYLNNPIFQSFRKIYLYNKGPTLDSNIVLPENVEILTLPNVGCEGHTYLHHIIHNKETLADKILFLPGSWFYTSNKQKAVVAIIQSISHHDFSALGHLHEHTVYERFQDFSLDTYQHTHISNVNPSASLAHCQDRPYGVWYEKNFSNRQSYITTYNGIFLTSSARIKANPPQLYENLISYLDNDRNPEAGHFMERSWAVVFNPCA